MQFYSEVLHLMHCSWPNNLREGSRNNAAILHVCVSCPTTGTLEIDILSCAGHC
jgi:hypothetical protein